ncbi:DUF4142 domain-containing protein [Hydrocarboniclastica marina]|uniref:DUF4142 domain-containing protein n=1 Tax=Hydrocarboniclastica marina TaxID=2259620 RepID=A0A4P7XKU1_9ALTE|nr:DUF4142 domain-containing protein [Hydrocarboniclastica marina]MAL98076.1 hypothetical protein [Alteromonadaceae bacterium]QCF27124.1 DUF4142 domain-containing protein [Hydrocarboniclastica marina]|tara:strand:- start:1539 stop:2138 length:600 start_codon:yes stop_codon:yes gene_type:complete
MNIILRNFSLSHFASLSRRVPLKATAAVLAASLALTACSMHEQRDAPEPLSEGQILQIMHSLNTDEIDQAELAIRDSDNRAVRDVAQHILRDHTESNERIKAQIESEEDLEESTLNNALTMQLTSTREEMSQLSGTEFDCFYLTSQVEQHELALDIVRSQLQPDAEETDVQSMLESTEDWLGHHLEAAEQARISLDECS